MPHTDPSDEQFCMSSTLCPPPFSILILWGCGGNAVVAGAGGVRQTHQASMIKSPGPMTMSVLFYYTNTLQRLWSGRVWTLPTLLGQRHGWCVCVCLGGGGIWPVIYFWWMGDITALGDRCHWRLKAPASGLERMEVERGERKERETVAAERVNTNTAGRADVKRVARWRGRSRHCR